MNERSTITDADRSTLRRYLAERTRQAFNGSTAPHADLLLETLAAHREQARREALEEAAREVEAYFPCGTIDKPEYAAGKALRDAIRGLGK